MARSDSLALSAAEAGGCCLGGAETPHAQRRRQILKAAQACFARSGFHGASMQEICAEAQMSPGGLYRYFRAKDDMIDAIAEDVQARNARLLAQLAGDGDLTDRLVAVAMAYLVEMTEPGAAALMAEVHAEGLRNSAVGEKFLRHERQVHEVIGTFLTEQVAAGAIAPVVALEPIMSLMCGVLDGIVLRMAADPDLTPALVEPQLRAIVGALLRPAAPGA